MIYGFKNVNILTENGIIKSNLIIKNGIIDKIGNYDCDGLVELSEDKIIVPGFIDQHIHGAGGADTIDGTKESLSKMASCLPEEGVTAFLATTDTKSIKKIDESLNAIKEYINEKNKTGAEILGVHLEGPFLNRKYTGAMIPEYIIPPTIELVKHFEEISGNNIKLVTMAIELENTEEVIKYLVSKNIVVSIGHSNASYSDIEEVIKLGVSCVTHTYNAQKPLRRDNIGVVGSTMLFDELYCEAICDGIHVSPPAIKLLYKNKPKDKFILVSDSLRAKYLPNGVYPEEEQIIVVNDGAARLDTGRLAGSILKLNHGIKNIMNFTGTDLISAIKCATENPAKNLGVFNRMGSIKEGKLANLVVIDKELNVYQTIREGIEIYKNNKII